MKIHGNWTAALSILILLVGGNALASSYSYDPLNRLTQVSYDNGTSINYIYDEAGNLTNQVIYDAVARTATFITS